MSASKWTIGLKDGARLGNGPYFLLFRGNVLHRGKSAMQLCMEKQAFGLASAAPQSILLQCGSESLSRAIVALLGRFLPRLGPLAIGERPFFLSRGYSAAAR
jgi:hypothetical protein